MRTRYGVSFWLDRYPKARVPVYPRLRGVVDTQVAVVCAGLSGAATAYAFALAGIDVVLLDAERVAQGSTAQWPGLLQLEPAASFVDLQQRYGLKAARAIWRTHRRAGLDLAATIRRSKIRCEMVLDASLRVGLHDEDTRPLTRELHARRTAGLDGTWLTPGRLRLETGLTGIGAIRSAGDGYIDRYRTTLGFAAEASRRGAAVYERSGVEKIVTTGDGVELKTDGGTVRAKTVVIAGNYPSLAFKPLRRHFDLGHTYCVLTPPLPSFVRRELGRSRAIIVERHDPRHFIRRTADDRLLCMGADQPAVAARSREKAVQQRTSQLMYELSKLYPAVSGIGADYGWDVQVSTTADGLPIIEPHRNYPRHLFALGMGHNGVAAPWLAARALVRHYRGRPTKEDLLFGFGRLR